ncbi:PKD domain-containing protein [Streptomyces erythrochromogenes]|uniref:PKD domain-containing protein n=1 Tax=Streptomyces erythrochromogenes TaxID=285574 RepID=UPI0036B42456
MAASIGFIPGTAQAADPVKPAAQAAGAPALDPAPGVAAGFETFTSGTTAGPQLSLFLSARMSSAHGFELTTSLNRGTPPLDTTIEWGDGSTDTVTASGSSETRTKHVYKELGEYTIKATVVDPVLGTQDTKEVQVRTLGSEFTPYGPTRLLDTRNGTGAVKAKVEGYSSARLKVAGNGAIPAGVTAVALNVTATNTNSGGHVSVFASGEPRPTASNINFEAGQSVPNLVIAKVGTDGYVELYNGGWEPVDLIADATGYFSRQEASGYAPQAPARVVDTRNGTGTQRGAVAGQGSFTVKVAEPGATAVALNVTVTNPQEAGHLTVHPAGQAAPTTSSVNFAAGQTVANSVIVPVGKDGEITIRNGAWAPSDVIVDLVGTYSNASAVAYIPVTPSRSIDTRSWPNGPWPTRGYVRQGFSREQEAWVMNTTVTNTRGTGFLSVAPDPNSSMDYAHGTAITPERPVSSTLNWTTGKTVANLVQTSTGEHGIVDLWNQGWDAADLIVDIFGYYDDK